MLLLVHHAPNYSSYNTECQVEIDAAAVVIFDGMEKTHIYVMPAIGLPGLHTMAVLLLVQLLVL